MRFHVCTAFRPLTQFRRRVGSSEPRRRRAVARGARRWAAGYPKVRCRQSLMGGRPRRIRDPLARRAAYWGDARGWQRRSAPVGRPKIGEGDPLYFSRLISSNSFSRWRGRGSRRRFLLPIDGVVSADHVTYDGNADEGHDYNDVEHAPYIIKIFPGCRG